MILKYSFVLPVSLLSVALILTSCKSITETSSNTGNGQEAEQAANEPTPAAEEKVVEKDHVKLNNVYFDFAKFNIRHDQVESLTHAAQTLKSTDMKIQLQGHTDDRGSAEFNIFLGENRANSVKHFLVSQGVKEEHISIISYGKEKPAAFCPDTGCATKEEQEEVWQKNRRVEFVPQ